jgi:hypothetical protein
MSRFWVSLWCCAVFTVGLVVVGNAVELAARALEWVF